MSKRWPSSPDEIRAEREAWLKLDESERQQLRLVAAGMADEPTPKRKRSKSPWRHYTKDEWTQTRKEIFERDGGDCYICGGQATQIDHVKPKSKFPELALDRENLRPICWPCNRTKAAKIFAS